MPTATTFVLHFTPFVLLGITAVLAWNTATFVLLLDKPFVHRAWDLESDANFIRQLSVYTPEPNSAVVAFCGVTQAPLAAFPHAPSITVVPDAPPDQTVLGTAPPRTSNYPSWDSGMWQLGNAICATWAPSSNLADADCAFRYTISNHTEVKTVSMGMMQRPGLAMAGFVLPSVVLSTALATLGIARGHLTPALASFCTLSSTLLVVAYAEFKTLHQLFSLLSLIGFLCTHTLLLAVTRGWLQVWAPYAYLFLLSICIVLGFIVMTVLLPDTPAYYSLYEYFMFVLIGTLNLFPLRGLLQLNNGAVTLTVAHAHANEQDPDAASSLLQDTELKQTPY